MSFLSNHKRGFTLLEAVLALMAFALMQLTFSQIIDVQIQFNHHLTQNYADDWAIFSIKLERLSQSSSLEVGSGRTLKLHDSDGRLISFEYYQNDVSSMVRKLVDNRGHQPVLMEVQDFRVKQLSKEAVKINIKMTNGDDYSQLLYFPAEKEVGEQKDEKKSGEIKNQT